MEVDKASQGTARKLTPLYDRYWALNDQRIHIDERISGLPPNDGTRDIFWQELERLLAEQHSVVRQLAKTPVVRLLELQAKAAVLATLLLTDVAGGSSAVLAADILALVLSLTDDIARLPEADLEAPAARLQANPASAPL